MGEAIDDLVNCRKALYGLLESQNPEQIDTEELYYAIKMLRASEPTKKQRSKALQ